MPGACDLLAAATKQGFDAKIVALHADDVVTAINQSESVIYRLRPKSYADYEDLVQRLNAEKSSALHLTLRAFDKIESYHLLRDAGIPTPRTWIIKDIECQNEFPIVMKVPRGSRGEGVDLVNNQEEYVQTATQLFVDNEQLVCQEFIAESAGSDKRIIVTTEGVIGAMVRHAKEGEFRANIHQGGVATEYVPTEEEAGIAMRAITALNLRFGGVDIIDSKNGPLVLEVNPSPGFAISSVIHKDVATEIIKAIMRN